MFAPVFARRLVRHLATYLRMFAKPKRSLHDNGSGPECKKSRILQPQQNFLRWKMWILRNYQFNPSSATRIADILSLSGSTHLEDKEQSVQEKRMSIDTLGRLVKEIWKGKVKRARRGPRAKREGYYLNLTRKHEITTDHNYARDDSLNSTSRADLHNLKVPENWSIIHDREEAVSFVRLEHYQANNHRAVLEVTVSVQEGRVGKCTVRANGSAVNLKLDQDLGLTRDTLSLSEQIYHILLTVEHSEICQGYRVLPGEEVVTLVPHHVQQVRDLTKSDDSEEETRAFSDDCLVILTPGRNSLSLSLCTNCLQLKNRDCIRKKRITKRLQQTVHLNCNNRYLEKSEIEDLLHEARMEKKNALKREEYWKNKFRDQSIEEESEDHQPRSDNNIQRD